MTLGELLYELSPHHNDQIVKIVTPDGEYDIGGIDKYGVEIKLFVVEAD